MRIPAYWRQLLRSNSCEKALIVTIAHPRSVLRDAESKRAHLMTMPGALRYATAQNVTVVDGSKVYPFWPLLTSWPSISLSLSPTERRVETPEVEIELAADSQFPHEEIAPGAPPAFICQIDLWARNFSNELSTEKLVTLFQGPVISAKVNRRTGAIRLTAREGDPQGDVVFPPGQMTISAADFPDAPTAVLNRARRQIFFGPYPYQAQAYQIDSEGLRYYLMEPWIDSGSCPTAFYSDGERITKNLPSVVPGIFKSNPQGQRYVEIVFRDKPSNAGYYGAISASGGVGIATNEVPLVLLRDIGGYRLTGRAETLLKRASTMMDFSVYINAQANVLDIVRDRILPQTPLVMGWRNGRIEMYELLGKTSSRRAAIGQGLISRVEESFSEPIGQIYNVIEVKYKRLTMPDIFGVAQDYLLVDKNYGGTIGSLLTGSERMYGRRMLSLEAMDLNHYINGYYHPKGVRTLGEVSAKLYANSHRRFTYNAEWAFGVEVDLNDRILLTDSDEGLDDEPTRVVGWTLLPTGPRVTLETEDAGDYET